MSNSSPELIALKYERVLISLIELPIKSRAFLFQYFEISHACIKTINYRIILLYSGISKLDGIKFGCKNVIPLGKVVLNPSFNMKSVSIYSTV